MNVEVAIMDTERFNDLMCDEDEHLTQEEIAEGWHFCAEFDGLLVKGDPNEKYCGQSCVEAECGSPDDTALLWALDNWG